MIKAFIDKDLGHVSYVLYSDNEACIIDPSRNISKYVKFLRKNGLTPKYILNTHPHADFISGHLELQEYYTDVKNVYHYKTPAKFDFFKVKQNDKISIGNLQIEVYQTEGHTPYCVSYLVLENGIKKYLFTGDFLFVGDIGRSDLLGEDNLDMLSGMFYENLKKISLLGDEIIIFTSHIEGSFCGKNLQNNYFSTLGIEKKNNIYFRLDKKEFKKKVIQNTIETPKFFTKMAGVNLNGPTLLKKLPKIKKVKKAVKGSYIIDFREPEKFNKKHIKGSINIPKKSNIALIAGSLLDSDKEIYIYKGGKKEIEKLRSVGFDNIVGKIKKIYNPASNESGNKTVDLDEIGGLDNIDSIDFDKNYRFVCKNGYKSSAVYSYLKAKSEGFI